MKHLKHISLAAFVLAAFAVSAGCQEDLDESAYTFACDGDGDCSGIYECLPSDEYDTDICQLPSDVDSSDAGEADGDTSQSDASDVTDGGDDTMDAADTSGSDATDTGDDDAGDACVETNGGEETCDGLDNDCDGAIDEGLPFDAKIVEVGANHACAVTADDEVYCWGDNTSGKAIPGEDGADLDYVRRPMRVEGIASTGTIDDLALGPNHSCALQDGTRIYCWGDNGRKQLGLGDPVSGELTEWSTSDISVADVSSFSDIEAGSNFSCGRALDKNLYCWGTASLRRMGLDVNDNAVADPIQLDTTKEFDVFDLGQTHGCAIDTPQTQGGSSSEVLCWGTNGFGQVGVSDTATCGLNGQDLLCWGDNATGQLAAPEGSTDQPEAVAIQPPSGYSVPMPGEDEQNLAMGEQHGCALATDGRAFCWGGGREGQLGDGEPGQIRRETVAVEPEHEFASIAAGRKVTCAIQEWGDEDDAGQLYCWGFNGSHQLGLGASDDQVAESGDLRTVNSPTGVACAPEGGSS